MAHPHVEQAVSFGAHVVLDVGEQPRMAARADLRVAELAPAGGFNPASELRRHRLQAVADAEHRRPEFEQHIRGAMSRGLVDRFGAPGKDDPFGRQRAQPLRIDVEGVDLGIHVRLAHAPRDELGVLRSEVEDDDPVGVDVGGCRYRHESLASYPITRSRSRRIHRVPVGLRCGDPPAPAPADDDVAVFMGGNSKYRAAWRSMLPRPERLLQVAAATSRPR